VLDGGVVEVLDDEHLAAARGMIGR